MKISRLDAIISSLNTDHEDMEVLVDIDGTGEHGCDFTVEREEEVFDGFDTVWPARLVITPKRDDPA